MCFWKHKWTKWTESSRGLLRSVVTRVQIGTYVIQKRHCEKCGKAQLRTERTY